jgi:hypothetical protein
MVSATGVPRESTTDSDAESATTGSRDPCPPVAGRSKEEDVGRTNASNGPPLSWRPERAASVASVAACCPCGRTRKPSAEPGFGTESASAAPEPSTPPAPSFNGGIAPEPLRSRSPRPPARRCEEGLPPGAGNAVSRLGEPLPEIEDDAGRPTPKDVPIGGSEPDRRPLSGKASSTSPPTSEFRWTDCSVDAMASIAEPAATVPPPPRFLAATRLALSRTPASNERRRAAFLASSSLARMRSRSWSSFKLPCTLRDDHDGHNAYNKYRNNLHRAHKRRWTIWACCLAAVRIPLMNRRLQPLHCRTRASRIAVARLARPAVRCQPRHLSHRTQGSPLASLHGPPAVTSIMPRSRQQSRRCS